MAAPNLTRVMSLRAYMSRDSVEVGKQRNGPHRGVYPFEGGHLIGVDGTITEGLHVEFSRGGADWLVFDDKTGIAHLDVRANGKDKDGAGFFIYYKGVLEMDDIGTKFNNWTPGVQSTQSKDHHWFTNPVIETNSESTLLWVVGPYADERSIGEKYSWMTTQFFLGWGHWYISPDGEKRAVEYDIYQVTK